MNKQSVWPDGKQCCVCVTFDLDAEWVFMGTIPETAKMPRRLSLGTYVWTANVIPRILDLLDEYNIKATFFTPGVNAENHPDVMKLIHSRGHELAIHGWRHENVDSLPKEEEKKLLFTAVNAIEKVTGVRPIGARCASKDFSPNTLDIDREIGLIYESGLRGSDLPYRLENGLVIVPSYYDMDDFHLFADYPGLPPYFARILSPEIGYNIWTYAFDGYYKYGLCYTTMFHPQIIGKPGLMILFDRLLSYIKKFPNVWYATAGEVAQYWIESTSR